MPEDISPFIKALYAQEVGLTKEWSNPLRRLSGNVNIYTNPITGEPRPATIQSWKVSTQIFGDDDTLSVMGDFFGIGAGISGLISAKLFYPIDDYQPQYDSIMQRIDQEYPLIGGNGGDGGNVGDGGEVPGLPYEPLKLNLENYSGAVMGKVTELTSALANIGSAYIRDIANQTVGRIVDLDREYRGGEEE